MKRRSFFQAAASSAALAVRGVGSESMNAPKLEESLPLRSKPADVDLADANATPWRNDPEVAHFVMLEEMYPSDPGELSGAALWVGENGEYMIFNAELVKGRGSAGLMGHCFGYLPAEHAAQFASEAKENREDLRARLFDLYHAAREYRYSGAVLRFECGEAPELQLWFGGHCLGVTRGRLMENFLDCVKIHSEAAQA